MLTVMKALILVFVFVLAASSAAQTAADGPDPVASLSPCSPNPPGAVLGDGVATGPEHGTLIAIGGGRLTPEVIGLFIDAAGGIDAPIVYVPTAHAGDLSQRDDEAYGVVRTLRARGCTDITVVHTRDRGVADTDAFIAPIERATGVWFSGGRQWRFVDAYLGTRACVAFHGVLERGGVIAGSSAGATIQASYLVRGAPEGNQIMMAEGHEQGFGFLENAAIDQHLFRRGRETHMIPVVERFEHLLGIGLDESAAIVVRHETLRVLDGANVAIYNHARMTDEHPYLLLKPGDEYDLSKREKINPGEGGR